MNNLTFRPLKEWANVPVPGNDILDIGALRRHYDRQLRRVLAGDVKTFDWIEVYFDRFTEPRHFTAFYRLLMSLRKLPNFSNMLGGRYVQTWIVNLTLQFDRRIREPETWAYSPDHTHQDFIQGLCNHLFRNYPVPAFLTHWVHNHNPMPLVEWYFHATQGGSYLELKGAPMPVSRAMAHELQNAPNHWHYPQVFRLVQLKLLGMHEDVMEWFLKTVFMDNYDNHEFWESVFRLLARELKPESYDEEDMATLLLYLGFAKLGMIVDNVDGMWQVRYVKPPFPDMDMQGRKLTSLLRVARRWYAGNRAEFGQWQPTGLPELSVSNDPEIGEGEFRMVELLTSFELSTEGQMMSHCVGEYSSNCREGNSSIWSLRKIEGDRQRRLVTIEVSKEDRELVQVCGPCNEPPTELDLKLIRRWAALGNIGLGEWVPYEAPAPAEQPAAPVAPEPQAAITLGMGLPADPGLGATTAQQPLSVEAKVRQATPARFGNRPAPKPNSEGMKIFWVVVLTIKALVFLAKLALM